MPSRPITNHLLAQYTAFSFADGTAGGMQGSGNNTVLYWYHEPVNELNNLMIAYQAQMKIAKKLEISLCIERQHTTAVQQQLRQAHTLLAQHQQQAAATGNTVQTEALQLEVQRLTADNQVLQNQYDSHLDNCRQLKEHVYQLVGILRQTDVMDSNSDGAVASEAQYQLQTHYCTSAAAAQTIYLGMFEYRKEDEPLIIKRLIYGLEPAEAEHWLPCLPAYILFMCVRYADHTNDREKLHSLLRNTYTAVKELIRQRREDIENSIFWLSNVLRLLNNMKQYSGEKNFQTENTPKQNKQCLCNIDVSEYWKQFADLAVWIYKGLIKQLKEQVEPLVVPGLLEQEAAAGETSCGTGSMNRILSVLSFTHRCLAVHGADQWIMLQMFRQIFYFICASSLNSLLQRKDLCSWAKGMLINYNLSHLEHWTRDRELAKPELLDVLAPITQATDLLQARKTDDDIEELCSSYKALSLQQIICLLTLYTPDELEKPLPPFFTERVKACLLEQHQGNTRGLFLDATFMFELYLPFNYSMVEMDRVMLPDALQLNTLRKL